VAPDSPSTSRLNKECRTGRSQSKSFQGYNERHKKKKKNNSELDKLFASKVPAESSNWRADSNQSGKLPEWSLPVSLTIVDNLWFN